MTPTNNRERRIAIAEAIRAVNLLTGLAIGIVRTQSFDPLDVVAALCRRIRDIANGEADDIAPAEDCQIEDILRMLELLESSARREPIRTSSRPQPVRTGRILSDWDRGRVLEQIEEASGVALSAGDSLPDSLIATAQALGMAPHELQAWIYDGGKEWNQQGLAAWARRFGFARSEGASV
jgi:hypothetical protein